MRKRRVIENDVMIGASHKGFEKALVLFNDAQLEVLLDIRDLLITQKEAKE